MLYIYDFSHKIKVNTELLINKCMRKYLRENFQCLKIMLSSKLMGNDQ